MITVGFEFPSHYIVTWTETSCLRRDVLASLLGMFLFTWWQNNNPPCPVSYWQVPLGLVSFKAPGERESPVILVHSNGPFFHSSGGSWSLYMVPRGYLQIVAAQCCNKWCFNYRLPNIEILSLCIIHLNWDLRASRNYLKSPWITLQSAFWTTVAQVSSRHEQWWLVRVRIRL